MAVVLEIPELLPETIIKEIHQKAELNKKFDRKNLKNKYLLSRVVKCAECGLSMFGQANNKKRLYYRHSRNGLEGCSQKGLSIPAVIIEEAVFYQLFSLFGDKDKLEKAIVEAVPDASVRPQLEKEIKGLKVTLTSVKKQKNQLLDVVMRGVFEDEDIRSRMDLLKEKEDRVKEQIAGCNKTLNKIPSEDEVKRKTQFAMNVLKYANTRYLNSVEHLSKMTWEERRKLVELVFSHFNNATKSDGVYVKKTDQGWQYEIQGSFSNNINGSLPMKRTEIRDLLDLDPDHWEEQVNLLSKRDAHYRLCFYQ